MKIETAGGDELKVAIVAEPSVSGKLWKVSIKMGSGRKHGQCAYWTSGKPQAEFLCKIVKAGITAVLQAAGAEEVAAATKEPIAEPESPPV